MERPPGDAGPPPPADGEELDEEAAAAAECPFALPRVSTQPGAPRIRLIGIRFTSELEARRRAAMLLLHGDSSGVLTLLVRLCEQLLPQYHTPTMDGLHAAQRVLLAILAKILVTVAQVVVAPVLMREFDLSI